MISVIIPCYNGNDVINDAIESCFNQGVDEEDLEIIVVDDNSERPIADDIYRQPNITCLRNSINLGPGGSRNVGIKAAKDNDFTNFLLCTAMDAILQST